MSLKSLIYYTCNMLNIHFNAFFPMRFHSYIDSRSFIWSYKLFFFQVNSKIYWHLFDHTPSGWDNYIYLTICLNCQYFSSKVQGLYNHVLHGKCFLYVIIRKCIMLWMQSNIRKRTSVSQNIQILRKTEYIT